MATEVNQFLDSCESEKLHLTGQIQSRGALLLVNHKKEVTHASENIATLWIYDVKQLLGKKIPVELDGLLDQVNSQKHVFRAEVDGRENVLDAIITPEKHGGYIVELLPSLPFEKHKLMRLGVPKMLRNEAESMEYKKELISWIAKVTNATRVMFYQFLTTGDGEVTAEAVRSDVKGSYLGLRFPASDVPQVARRIYLELDYRIIFDVNSEPTKVLSWQMDDTPDLSRALLRSVAPVHVHYMRNMGVRSSVSWPIKQGDNLKALISLHHDNPEELSQSVLINVTECVQNLNYLLRDFSAQERVKLHDRMQARFGEFLQRFDDAEAGYEEHWHLISSWLMSELSSDGVMLVTRDKRLQRGVVLEDENLEHLLFELNEHDDTLFLSDELHHDVNSIELSSIAGVAVVRLPILHGDSYFIATREAYLHEVSWGGQPDKPTESTKTEVPISPRRSFEKWVEVRMNHSKPWSEDTRIKLIKVRLLLSKFLN